MKPSDIERLEIRIDFLKQDSKMCTHRIDYFTKQRAQIQKQIVAIKQRIKKGRK